MSYAQLILASLLLAVPSVAFADSIQYILNGTIVLNVSTSSDDRGGYYSSVEPSQYPGTSASVNGSETVLLPDFSVVVPAGNIITSALFSFLTSNQNIFLGTGYEYPIDEYGGAGTVAGPAVAPTYSRIGTSEIQILVDEYQDLPAMTNGDEAWDELYYPRPDPTLEYWGQIQSPMVDPGSNWAGWIGGVGQVDIPYTVELDVTYSPVPEPSSFTLLGIGMFGLAGTARRKLFSRV